MMEADSSALVFRRGGKKIVGVYGRPSGKAGRRFPAVLFLHGFPGSEHNADVRRELLRRGVASLCLHFEGAWGSEGEFRFTTLLEQARAGLRFLAARPEVDRGRLAAFGFSMGGWTALHLAATAPELKAVVAVAPVGGAREMLRPGAREFVLEHCAAVSARSPAGLFKDFQRAMNEGDPAESAAKVRSPLLLIHGTGDDVVPFAASRRIAAARPGARFVRAEGAGHSFLDRRPWLVRRTTDFLSGKLS